MIKAVVDTNVLVSDIISPRSSPAKIIDLWQKRKFILITSKEILKELKQVLSYPKISKAYRLNKEKIEEYIRGFFAFSEACSPNKRILLVKEDPEDNKFIEAASFAKANFIVSGDHHLLSVGEYSGIKILTAKKFLQELGKMET